LRADVCYKYETKATSKICIKSDLLDTTDDSVCTVAGDKTTHNSGAPIQVIQFSQSAIANDRIAFTFKVAKKANGNVYKTPTTGFNACEPPAGQSERSVEDKVYVEVDSGATDLKCSALKDGSDTTGYVTLYGSDQSATIRCTQTADSATDFEKIVNINLKYEYEEYISTTLIVKHELTE